MKILEVIKPDVAWSPEYSMQLVDGQLTKNHFPERMFVIINTKYNTIEAHTTSYKTANMYWTLLTNAEKLDSPGGVMYCSNEDSPGELH